LIVGEKANERNEREKKEKKSNDATSSVTGTVGGKQNEIDKIFTRSMARKTGGKWFS
jgi:hypothetical protein